LKKGKLQQQFQPDALRAPVKFTFK